MALIHRHSAKAAVRSLFKAHGKSGAIFLLAEVLREELPARRGRPTREEADARAALKALALAAAAFREAGEDLTEEDAV